MVHQALLRSKISIALCFSLLGCQTKETETVKEFPLFNVEKIKLTMDNGLVLYKQKPLTGTIFTLFFGTADTAELLSYLDGREHGQWKKFYPSTKTKEVRYFKNGGKTGIYNAWWENGKKQLEYSFVADEYEGECKEWNEEGQLSRIMNYRKEGPSLPFYNTPEFSPEFFDSEEKAQAKITHTISKFSFQNQNGTRITEKDIEGKAHVANFIFTSCGSICPVLTKHMKEVQKAFKDKPSVVILSYSVTPWIDSVPVLKRYAKLNEITSPNWHLLTGDKNEIYTLARKSYFAEEDLGFTKDNSNFLHTEHVLLIDSKKRIRGIPALRFNAPPAASLIVLVKTKAFSSISFTKRRNFFTSNLVTRVNTKYNIYRLTNVKTFLQKSSLTFINCNAPAQFHNQMFFN